MKKILLALAALLWSTVSLLAGSPVTVKSGDLSVLKTPAKAKIVFNYSGTYVGEDGARTMTLNKYLNSRGKDFVKDWPSDHAKAEEYFAIRFSKKNKKGLTAAEKGEKAQYTMTVNVKTLDMGNAAGAFIGMSAKAGGVIMWGDITIKNAKGKVVLTLDVDGVKGKASPSESMRLGLCYMDLATRIAKLK